MLGLLIGSFLNVVIHRLPIMLERRWRAECAELLGDLPSPSGKGVGGEPPRQSDASAFNLVVPRSRCPACQAPIRAWQNIPVISYLLLRGRCASCSARISIRYPIVELITAMLSAVVVWKFGASWAGLAALVLTWSLIALTVIDLDRQLLPDAITLPLLWAGLLLCVIADPQPGLSIPVDLRSSVIGAVAGYLTLWSVYWLFKLLTGKEGMGYGDFKLLAALGAWFGWQMLPMIILLSAFSGAVVGIALILLRRHKRDAPIPFGPYLAAAGWITLMWGPQIIQRYLPLTQP